MLSNLRQGISLRTGSLSQIIINRELPQITVLPNRSKSRNFNRHRDQRYRLERGRKVWKIDLPDFDHMRKEDVSVKPDEVRSKLKEKGIAPPSNWDEREVYTPCTLSIIDPYKPHEGEGKYSLLEKVKTPFLSGKDMIKSRREVSAIRTFEGEDFDLKEFAKQSTSIYVKAHEVIAQKDEKKVFDYVTEACFPLMTAGLNHHTVHWKYLGDVEPPKAIQVRSGDLISKGNKYAQITVKMYTKQMMAIYDRHGRLVHGSPTDVKEVLEYIVFEKYLADEYGLWRIHGRIKPEEEMKVSQVVAKTYVASQ